MKKYLISALLAVGVIGLFQSSAYAQYTYRIEGKDRFKTSIAVSQKGWETSDYVVIANGLNFPDALAASPLAAKYNAPIILVNGKELSTEIKDELTRLGVKEAFIIGGKGVVSSNIETSISDMNIKVNRYGGNNRYETAVEVAKNLGDFEEVVITNGMGFADALSMAPIAAQKGMPILLTSKDSLDKSVTDFLNSKLNGDSSKVKAYIIGGPLVVSENIEKQFSNKERLYGASRYETNATILNKFASDINCENIYIASGQDFPDALSGSALAAKNSAPIILSNKIVSLDGENFINSKIESIVNINLIGGKAITPDAIFEDLNSSNESGNTKGNAQNLGLVDKSGEWIYHKDNEYGFIYKSSTDGTKNIKLNSQDSYFLNVVGQWIYYTDLDGSLFRVSTDGTKNESIGGIKADYIEVEGDYIYYLTPDTEGWKLNRVDLEGNNNEFISNINSLNVIIKGDWVYYSDDTDGGIYKFNINDKDNRSKIVQDMVTFMVLQDDFMYYLNEDGVLSKINLDGTGNKTLTGNSVLSFNVQGNYIYYSNANDSGKLYKMNLDGGSSTKLADDGAALINTVGGWIYYVNEEFNFMKIRVDGTMRQIVK